MFLNENKFLYVLNCNYTKEVWDTLKMIYGISLSIKQERMNTRVQEVVTLNECEFYLHRWCSTIRNLGGHVRTFVINKYIKINNQNQNSDPILKPRDGSVYDFQEKSRKEEIIEKLNELIHLLKDEGMSSRILEESLATLSKNYVEEEEENSTLVISFERKNSMDELF